MDQAPGERPGRPQRANRHHRPTGSCPGTGHRRGSDHRSGLARLPLANRPQAKHQRAHRAPPQPRHGSVSRTGLLVMRRSRYASAVPPWSAFWPGGPPRPSSGTKTSVSATIRIERCAALPTPSPTGIASACRSSPSPTAGGCVIRHRIWEVDGEVTEEYRGVRLSLLRPGESRQPTDPGLADLPPLRPHWDRQSPAKAEACLTVASICHPDHHPAWRPASRLVRPRVPVQNTQLRIIWRNASGPSRRP
jgi:hypothetical protein